MSSKQTVNKLFGRSGILKNKMPDGPNEQAMRGYDLMARSRIWKMEQQKDRQPENCAAGCARGKAASRSNKPSQNGLVQAVRAKRHFEKQNARRPKRTSHEGV